MAKRAVSEATEFSNRVAAAVDRAVSLSGRSVVAVIKDAEMSRNYYYTRLRGEKPFNTNDIDMLAQALGVDPIEMMLAASRPTGDVGGASEADALDNVTMLSRAEVAADLELRPAANTRTRKADREPYAD